MLSYKNIVIALVSLSISASAYPILRREVPQEHSHEKILTAVRTSLNTNNPQGIVDPVFALLGNAAAAAGLGQTTDPDCLQQATADQAFTNAKAANDVDGMVNALIFRALERNSGAVGQLSANCTSVTAVNPEIAALSQHQDPAADGATANNQAVTLALAQQIASVGGDPTLALESGTFAPGTIGDPTAAGNTCDDANDTEGCIFSQNLLVDDVTADEIAAAVSGVSAASTAAATSAAASAAATASASSAATSACSDAATVTQTTTVSSAAATASAAATSAASASAAATTSAATSTASAAAGQNLQTFTGTVGGSLPPAVTAGGRGFVVSGSDDFLNVGAALTRSCSIQHNACANAANSGAAAGVTVGDCDTQETQCSAAATA